MDWAIVEARQQLKPYQTISAKASLASLTRMIWVCRRAANR